MSALNDLFNKKDKNIAEIFCVLFLSLLIYSVVMFALTMIALLLWAWVRMVVNS